MAEATQAAMVEEKRKQIWKEVEERWVRRDVHKLEMEAEAARQVGAAVEHVAEQWKAEQWKARLHEVRLSCASAMERAVQDAVAEAVNEAATEAGRTEWQLRAQLQHLTRQTEEATAARAKAEAACAEATEAAEEATSSKHAAAMVAADKQRASTSSMRGRMRSAPGQGGGGPEGGHRVARTRAERGQASGGRGRDRLVARVAGGGGAGGRVCGGGGARRGALRIESGARGGQ